MPAVVIDDVPIHFVLLDVVGQQLLGEILVEVAAEVAVGVLLDIGPRRVHDLSRVGREGVMGGGVHVRLFHDVPGRLTDGDVAIALHCDDAVLPRRGVPLLGLALLCPFLGDAMHGVDDGCAFHDRTATLDLPRSR
jgi:hypothetical protein